MLVCLLLAAPSVVFAQLNVHPYVSAQVQNDSNVFRLPSPAFALLYNGNPRLSDTDETYVAGLDGTYEWSRQILTAKLEGRELEYQHFTDLDHAEYLGDLRLNWKLLSVFDGIVEYHQEHVAANFANRDSNTLELNTDTEITGKLNYEFNPDWRIESGITDHTLKAPLEFYPDFTDHETSTHLGATYLGVANLTYGFGWDHIAGNYTHAVGVGPYTENTEQFQVTYKLTGLSSFNGAVGYTDRDQTLPAGKVGGVTGSLGYNRQLTGKTSFYVRVARAVSSYLAAAGSEIDSQGYAGITWATTYKLSVSAQAGYDRSVYIGQVIPGSLAVGRVDRNPTGALIFLYKPFKHLDIKAYVNKDSRSSNYELYTYNDTTYGIQLKGHW